MKRKFKAKPRVTDNLFLIIFEFYANVFAKILYKINLPKGEKIFFFAKFKNLIKEEVF